MNITRTNYNYCKTYTSLFRPEHKLYRFISILLEKDKVRKASAEKRLTSLLSSIQPAKNFQEYQDVVFPILGLTCESALSKRKAKVDLARKYANILEQYSPDQAGDIKQNFTFYQLVELVGIVFKKHMKQSVGLLHDGIKVSIGGLDFYAKVENEQIFIFESNYAMLGSGAFGNVGKAFEIATKQFIAVKWANESGLALNQINREIRVLKNLHTMADFEDFSMEGFQDRPLAEFYLPGFTGYLGPVYGINLVKWLDGQPTNEERLVMVRAVVKAFADKERAGYWHGDLKLENFVIGPNGIVMIDWAGALLYHKAAKDFSRSEATTAAYLSVIDLDQLDKIKDEGLYIQTAKSLELFFLANNLFCLLASEDPFDLEWNDEYELNFPMTKNGIHEHALESLMNRNYSQEVVQTLVKMLAHKSEDRYSTEEAIEIWGRL